MLQHRVPAFTVPQPDEAMCVLEEKASQLDVSCTVLSLPSTYKKKNKKAHTMNYA